MSLEDRVARLEATNERLRKSLRLQRVVVAGVASLVTVGLLTAAGTAGKVVQAQEIRVLNPDGSARILMTANPENPGIALYDQGGKPRLTMTVTGETPKVRLYDADGRPSAVMAVSEQRGSRMILTGPGRSAAVIEAGSEGPMMGLTAVDGTGAFRVP